MLNDNSGKWSPSRVAITFVAAVAFVLFVMGVVSAALYITVAFILTALWIAVWLRDIYLSDVADRAALRRSDDGPAARY